MIDFIYVLLGLCRHSWKLTSVVEVPFNGNEGKFIHIDLAKRGAIKHVEKTFICRHCSKEKTIKIKR